MARILSQDVSMQESPWRLSGTVYGALLNHKSALAALGPALDAAPYQGAPRAPVLYVKPRNTLSDDGDPVAVPAGVPELEVGACLGLVIGRTACHVNEREALGYLAGYLIVNDLSVPHLPYYRPSVRAKARDGFCPLGPRVTAAAAIADPDALRIRVFIGAELRQSASSADLVRPVARLLADVTEFMTLAPGDVLAVGAAAPAPRAGPGDEVSIEIEGLGRLTNRLVGGGA